MCHPSMVNKTYYMSQREVSLYLTADECNECCIFIGTTPGTFPIDK